MVRIWCVCNVRVQGQESRCYYYRMFSLCIQCKFPGATLRHTFLASWLRSSVVSVNAFSYYRRMGAM